MFFSHENCMPWLASEIIDIYQLQSLIRSYFWTKVTVCMSCSSSSKNSFKPDRKVNNWHWLWLWHLSCQLQAFIPQNAKGAQILPIAFPLTVHHVARFQWESGSKSSSLLDLIWSNASFLFGEHGKQTGLWCFAQPWHIRNGARNIVYITVKQSLSLWQPTWSEIASS